LLILFSGSGLMTTHSQESADSSRVLKNTIRVNITNPMLFGDKYRVVGYERVINEHQSFSVNICQFSLPKFKSFNSDSIVLNEGYDDKGFAIATDYRFYLKKENKYVAPRGVYIGPYYSFNTLKRRNTWALNTSDFLGEVYTDLRLNTNLVGFQLGYQFIIKERIAIDLIMFGPGIWFYSVKTSLSTNLSEEDEKMLFEKINSALAEKLPGSDILIEPGENLFRESFTSASVGFRYVINIGFRF